MAILVINCGSSSIKCSYFSKTKRKNINVNTSDIKKSLSQILQELELESEPIEAVGHRVVHGASFFHTPTKLTGSAIEKIKEVSVLAPLHNRAALAGIEIAKKHFPKKVIQIACFDTSFYRNMPKCARSYAISKKFAIERYGFHGISHAYLYNKLKDHLKKELKVISLHLGAGCSITAVDKGDVLDTSMGFTPQEGLVMATRAGDIDPFVVEYLAKKEKLTTKKVLDILTFESGLKGVSGFSSDMQELLKSRSKDAQFAIDLFVYRCQKYIGAYMQVLKGIDAIIFSGGIGENSPEIRAKIVEGLHWLSISLDKEKNNRSVDDIYQISKKGSVFVIKTDENKAIKDQISSIL